MSWNWSPESLSELARFLGQHDLLHGELRVRRIGDGHSNLTFLVEDGGRRVVVRRPPPPPTPPGGHDVLREARLIAALQPTGLPLPRVLATAVAGDVLDVPLYVMDYVPGVVVTDALPAAFAHAGEDVVDVMVDTFVALHAIDWRMFGLQSFGRSDGFLRRHLHRLGTLVASQESDDTSARLISMQARLERTAPTEGPATLIHNDYRIGNVMWAESSSPELLAVLDWELATLGDPLFDLGYALACYPHPGLPLTPIQESARALLAPGVPPRSEFIRRYAERSGRDLSLISWYVAMADWKLAVLFAYSRRRGEDAYYADPALAKRFLDAADRALDSSATRVASNQ